MKVADAIRNEAAARKDAQRRYGSSRVHGVLFTATSKQHLATVGKQSFEDSRERIPMGDQELRADLHKLRKETGPTGNVRFVADSDAGGHADRAWAGFLATAAASEPTLDMGLIKPVGMSEIGRYAPTERTNDAWGTVRRRG